MLRREGMHFFLLFTLTACTAAAVGPVMNDSPPTVYDQIKNRTDLTEVNELNFFFSSFSSSLFVLFGVFVFFLPIAMAHSVAQCKLPHGWRRQK